MFAHKTSFNLIAAGLLLLGCTGAPGDETAAVTRTVLIKQALSTIADKEGQIVMVNVAPGKSTGRHTHPVDEFVYVLEGTGTLMRPAQNELTVNAGETLVLTSGQVHEMKNATGVPLKFLQFSVPAPGQVLAMPAP